MQDTKEQINYDDYQIVFDGQLMAIGGSEHGDLIDFYKVVIKFASVEIIEKRRDWSELGKYFDYNLTISTNPYEFLSYIFDNYYLFYTNNVEYIALFGSLKTGVQLQITRNFIEWYAVQMEDISIKTYSDNATGYALRKNYAKIRPQSTPTPPPPAEGIKFINPYELAGKQWNQILEPFELMGIGFNENEPTPTLSAIEEIAITAPLPVSKIGRPKSQNVIKRKEMLFKEFLRLTETRSDYEAKQILLTTFKKYFTKSPETNRRNLDRTIREMKGQ